MAPLHDWARLRERLSGPTQVLPEVVADATRNRRINLANAATQPFVSPPLPIAMCFAALTCGDPRPVANLSFIEAAPACTSVHQSSSTSTTERHGRTDAHGIYTGSRPAVRSRN